MTQEAGSGQSWTITLRSNPARPYWELLFWTVRTLRAAVAQAVALTHSGNPGDVSTPQSKIAPAKVSLFGLRLSRRDSPGFIDSWNSLELDMFLGESVYVRVVQDDDVLARSFAPLSTIVFGRSPFTAYRTVLSANNLGD